MKINEKAKVTREQLISHLEAQLRKLNAEVEKREMICLKAVKKCKTFKEAQRVVRSANTGCAETLIEQYEETLDFLSFMPTGKEIELDQSQYKHFYKGQHRAEMC